MSKISSDYDPLRAKTKVALSVAVSFLFGLGLASQFGFTSMAFPTPEISTEPQVPAAAVQPALELSEAFVNIADAVTPSVVRIEARRQARRTAQNDAFRRFFQDPGGDDQSLPDIQTAGGSGFIVSEDGYVMTNNHVIDEAEGITVVMRDGRTFPAELVGTDPTTDVAVLKVDETGLPAISLGSSTDVRVGEWILAVGNPGFGGGQALDYTVTAGIVSALGRGIRLLNNDLLQDPRYGQRLQGFAIEDFIQTDAVINPGNSGGPMVNLRGQVIGINSAIASSTGFYQGYGFAIPIDLAQRVTEDLIAYGHVRRAYLGVRMQAVTPEDAEALGLPRIAGALVQEVTEDTPAERAGLQRFDVITEIDGEEIRTSNDLQHKIALKSPGDRVNVTVFRDGEPREIEVRLDQAPITEAVAAAPEPRVRMADKIGIEVADITPDLAESLGLESTDGVVVTGIQRGGPAARRGNITRGSVIHEINGQTIRNSEDVDEAFRRVEAGQVVSLVVETNGATNLVNVRVPGN
ncbi:MAG: PDZ domain-containing protein [Gemmatimonadetes bacterium]|nr:PDZ domain-containing protein [Gemmatimonadota bacterium]